MNTKTLLGIISAILAVLVIILLLGARPEENENGNKRQPSEAEQALGRLPYAFTVGERTIVFDRQTVPESPRDEYSFREATTLPRAVDDPVDYIESILQSRLTQEHIAEQPEFFDYTASFYPLQDNGVSAFVRTSNIPDDAIGAAEERFDLAFRDGQWNLDWYGQRHFCRRPMQEFWAPADFLCP